MEALYELEPEALADLVKSLGQPAFRAKQIHRQLYVKKVASIEEMTDLPKAFRESLATTHRLGALECVRVFKGDGGLTRKGLFQLKPGVVVEAVLMVYPGRATVCVSSQAGCPMGCVFCATAKLGFLHDLTPGHMIQQVLWAEHQLAELRADPASIDPTAARKHRIRPDDLPQRVTNIVFMGMGEPFNNYANWYRSVERLHDPKGYNLGARSFTVSTVGLVPGIRTLADAPLQINLAVSLHSADDARRSAMMPVNRRYPIADLLDAIRHYTKKTNRRVSFEYVLLDQQNDTPEEAHELASLLTAKPRFPCHVNLIPWNPVAGTGLARSTRARIDAFRDILEDAGLSATIRIQRGADIDAACGQLAGGVA